MDILGVEIDPSFVYRVDAISHYAGGSAGYLFFFRIYFKDGSKFLVEISLNMYYSDVGKGAFYRDHNISPHKLRGLDNKKIKNERKITSLRDNLIKQMNERRANI